MLSHRIIKHKQVVHQLPHYNTPRKNTNKSFIKDQETLDFFLKTKPKVGEYVYRSLAHDGTTTLPFDSPTMLSKVVSIVTKFEDLTFSWQEGFPETHKIITLFRGPVNPWIRMEDITRFSVIPEDKKEWLNAELQDNFKAAILQTTD